MRTTAALAALGLLLLGGACTDATAPVAPVAGAIVGRWTTAPQPLQPRGTLHYVLTFAPNGRFVSEWRMHGVYQGQPAGTLSSRGRATGTYVLEEDRLRTTADSLVTWDRFYGADSPETVQAPPPYGPPGGDGPYDGARVSLSLHALTLHYLSYPADAPVETTQRFVRDR